jgi:hypothetical protein
MDRYFNIDIEGAELALFQQTVVDFAGFDFLAVEIDFLLRKRFRQFRLRVRTVR